MTNFIFWYRYCDPGNGEHLLPLGFARYSYVYVFSLFMISGGLTVTVRIAKIHRAFRSYFMDFFFQGKKGNKCYKDSKTGLSIAMILDAEDRLVWPMFAFPGERSPYRPLRVGCHAISRSENTPWTVQRRRKYVQPKTCTCMVVADFFSITHKITSSEKLKEQLTDAPSATLNWHRAKMLQLLKYHAEDSCSYTIHRCLAWNEKALVPFWGFRYIMLRQ